MLDWLPHHERGQISHPVLGTRDRGTRLVLARVSNTGFPDPMTPLSYSMVVRPFLEAYIIRKDVLMYRPWYGYLYVTSDAVDLPPSVVPGVTNVKVSRLTTQQLLVRARTMASQSVIARSSLAAAALGLANFEAGPAAVECRRALDEIALRMCEGGVLDTVDALQLLNDDELDDYVTDPQIYLEALRARAALFADVADREPPEGLDPSTPAYGRWPRRGGIRQR